MGKKSSKSKNNNIKTEEKKDLNSKNKTSNEDVDFNLNSLFNMKFLTVLIPILFIIIGMYVAYDVRTGILSLDGLDRNIEANIYSNIESMVGQEIDMQYPNLNPQFRQEMIDEELKKIIESGVVNFGGQEIFIDDLIGQQINTIKSALQADNGQTYLPDIDPFYYYRESLNYHFNGHTGDTMIENEDGEMVPHTALRIAPVGREASYDPSFQTWIQAVFLNWYGITPESSEGERMKAVYMIPVFFVMLVVIPTFFLIRKFTGNIFALMSALLMVSFSTFVSRTTAGVVDTEPYGVVFPVIIVALFIFSLIYINKNLILGLYLAIIAGFFVGFFGWSWNSAWFIVVFLLISIIGYIGYLLAVQLIENRKLVYDKKIINDIYIVISFILSSIIFTYLFIKENLFSLVYEGTYRSITRLEGANMWPNVYSSVAELNPASFSQIMSSVGGQVIFLFGLLGILFLIMDFKKSEKLKIVSIIIYAFSILWFLLIIFANMFVSLSINDKLLFLILLFLPIGVALIYSLIEKNKKVNIFFAIILSVWLAGTIYMSFNGVRFIMLLGAPLALSFGIFMYYIATTITNFLKNEINIENKIKKNDNIDFPKVFSITVSILIFAALFFGVYSTAQNISNNMLPHFDDSWYETMYQIRDNSNPDAIITSWWDFGHFFAAIAQRGVTFDGASQATPASHWVGKLLLENDEEVAKDILWMLSCGNNMAHDYMHKITYDENETHDSARVVLINKIIYETFGQENKREILENNKYFSFTSEEVDGIMNYLACENPPEVFLVTSGDMIGKAPVWAHWGLWDFTKRYVLTYRNSMSAEEIANNIDEDVNLIERYISEIEQIHIRARRDNQPLDQLINQWYSPYPSYFVNQVIPCRENEANMLSCPEIGLNLDLNNMSVSGDLLQQITIKNVVYPTMLGKNEIVEISENGIADIILMPTQEGYGVMLAETPLGGSLFTTLYFMGGATSKYFEVFADRQSVLGNRIVVWKTNWEGKEFDDPFEINLDDLDFNFEDLEMDGNELDLSQGNEIEIDFIEDNLELNETQ